MKSRKNIFSILSIMIFIISLVLFIVSLVFSDNIIMVIVSLILFIADFILSILGVTKATSIKNETGKFKGFVSSIISLVLSIICILITIASLFLYSMDFSNNSKNTTNTNSSKSSSKSNSKNTIENTTSENKKNTKKEDTQGLSKSGYTTLKDTVKELKNSSYDPDSFKLYEISVYYYNDEKLKDGYFKVIITYSGTNAYGGTVRNYYFLTFVENKISGFQTHNYKTGEYDKAEERAKEGEKKKKILDLEYFE